MAPDEDAYMAHASLPRNAARISAPVLLAYGSADFTVPLVHGQQLRDALSAAGNPPEWVVYADEGHGWLKPAHRLDFARRVEAFLARHLQPAGAASAPAR